MRVKLEVPTRMNDIPLRLYQEYCLIEEPTEADVVSIFLELSRATVRDLKSQSFELCLEKINNALNEEVNLVPTFKLGGIEFGFEPNLDDITYGVNKDAVEYLKDTQSYHQAMAVLYRPVIKRHKSKYLIEKYEGSSKYSELMKEAPLDVVLGMTVFFYNLINDLLNCIPNFLEKAVQKLESQEKEHSQISGEVMEKSIHSLKEILDGLKRSQKLTFTNV